MNNPATPGEAGETSNPVLPAPTAILGTLARARSMTVSEAAEHAVSGTVVKLAGHAVPGPDGPLRAPLSGLECVWYRSIVFRSLREPNSTLQLQPMNPLAPSDAPSYGATHRVGLRGQRLGSDTSSSSAFAISDGTATVRIDPRTTDVDTDIFGVNERVVVHQSRRPSMAGNEFRGGLFGPDEVHTEWVIPVGAEVLAVGTVRQSGVGTAELVRQGEDIVLVSTKSEQRILSRNQAAVNGPHLPFTSPRSVYLFLGAFVGIGAIIVLILLFVFVF